MFIRKQAPLLILIVSHLTLVNQKTEIKKFIAKIPKAELHLHIEGTLEPKSMLTFAKRNHIKTKYDSIVALKRAYHFRNLQDFLNIYYAGAQVLKTRQDFYDLTFAYLKKARCQNVLHTEIFFDPQIHTERGVSFENVVSGIYNALQDGQKEFHISSRLIMCFLRHLNEEAALLTLKQALGYKDWITAVGLDSSELDHPPSKFERVFERARANGFITVAHAGEEGPARYIWEALKILKVSRIDHGNCALDDEKLVQELVKQKIPLTICPLSNLKLQVVKNLSQHPLKIMLKKGLLVTINSDDPAYFGGYINANYEAISGALNLSQEEIRILAWNSFAASFLDAEQKKYYQNNR